MKTLAAVFMAVIFILASGTAWSASLEESLKKVERELSRAQGARKTAEQEKAKAAEPKKTNPQAAPKAAERGNAETQALRKRVEQGDAQAQYELGRMYASGDGAAKDVKQAAVWFRKAAERGHAEAQNTLGRMYASGDGVAKDLKQAAAWWRKAAEQRHYEAEYELGRMYDAGQGVAKDAKLAADWFGKAGRGGLAEDAAYDELHLDIVRKKAEQGDGLAQSSLGRRYERGVGVAKDLKQAAFWFRKAAEQRTVGPLRSLRKKADQGEAEAQSGLGFVYFGADGVLSLPGDATQGAVWQRKAAEQGYANAQYQLAWQYENGWGVAKDLKQAEFWRRKWEARKK